MTGMQVTEFKKTEDKNIEDKKTEEKKMSVPVKVERDVIEVVNNLQNVLAASGHSLDVSLPQIVVVGSQSAGKSSVLENIVGKEFLPRGSGVVTRRPIIVQLNPCTKEYAIFLHKPGEKFTDFSQVRTEIERETAESLGNKGFSSIPIQLQIYSPNVLKLTLVDLPGLIKNPTDDQPSTIVEEVREMVMEYVSQPKSLILAVSPANQDLANSDALNIANIVDAERERTIGVLTKLDLMDQGTDARDILENKHFPLKRGYVGVINRSQKDIDEKRDISYVLEKERDFFKNHPAYRHLSNRMGTKYLQQLLQKQLQAHIKAHLGELRKELSDSFASNKRKLDILTERFGVGEENKQALMMRLTQEFVDDMKLKLEGKSEQVDFSKMSPGAHIYYLMHTKVQEFLDLELIPDKKELTIVMANIQGFRTGIAVPSLAVDAICRKLIDRYKEPVRRSVSVISKIVIDAVEESANEFNGFPTLKKVLKAKVESCIKRQEEIAKEILIKYVEAEMYTINIDHPDFEGSILQQVAPPTGPIRIWEEHSQTIKQMASNGNVHSTEELLELSLVDEGTQKKVTYVSAMISKYLELVRKTIGDITIKYILYFLIKQVLDFLSFNLTAELTSLGNLDSLMQKCEEDILLQEELEFSCQTISSALEAIQLF